MAVDRVDLLRASTTLTGIDFVEISATQTELTLFLQHDTLPAALAATLAAISPSAISIVGRGAGRAGRGGRCWRMSRPCPHRSTVARLC